MTSAEPQAVPTELAETIRAKLQTGAGPLKLTELAKPKPRARTTDQYQSDVQRVLEDHIRLGLAYRYPSAKGGVERYWHKDEKQLLRDRALELAATPQPLSKLTTSVAKAVTRVDKGFVQTLIQELIRDDELFEYPPATPKGGSRFGAIPPPPPIPALQQDKHRRALNSLVAAAQKLLAASGASADDLMSLLRDRLVRGASESAQTVDNRAARSNPIRAPISASEIESLILKEVEHSAAVSLADLRESMPVEFRGQAFDEAILRLADQYRISVHEDAEPSSFTDVERARYVQDGRHLYTAITKRR